MGYSKMGVKVIMNKSECFECCIKHGIIKKLSSMSLKYQKEYLSYGRLESQSLYRTKAGGIYAIVDDRKENV